ncbi:MAG: 1-deoxy-D-xylulose-5-phosphate reductoisomerase [Pseudomonadota bacterium]
MVKRRVSLFGATGSIGQSTVDLLKRHADKFEVVTVAANSRATELAKIAIDLSAQRAIVCDESTIADLRYALSGKNIEVSGGENALLEAASEKVDLVIMAISGAAGLRATFAAAETGADLALANKESIVCAGNLLMRKLQASRARLLPVDSEHNALFQILDGRDQSALQKVTLTASGGPFRNWSAEKIAAATPEDALAHPVWNMGEKISIDCATLINKGLELIEAQHIFALKPEQLDVLVHPQSTVHAFVSYSDGSVLAQMAKPDMRVAISACLSWPQRLASGVESLDLAKLQSLTFEQPDLQKFPCLKLVRSVMQQGGALPCILNAANEIAVSAFLRKAIGFNDIYRIIAATLENTQTQSLQKAFVALEDVLQTDRESRRIAASLLPYSEANLQRAIA